MVRSVEAPGEGRQGRQVAQYRHPRFSWITLLTTAVAVLTATLLLIAPSQSRAAEEPFRIDFDQSELQFGLLSDLPLGEIASTGSLEGTIDETGKVTVPKGSFRLPEVGITDPVSVKLFMGIESDATGTFNRETGELVLNAKAGVWLSVDLQQLLGILGTAGIGLPTNEPIIQSILGSVKDLTCGFSPMNVTFTTGETSLGSGQPFTAGPLGPGALTAEWSQLGPFAGKTRILGLVDVCQAIKMYAPELIQGGLGGVLPGGIDLGGLDIESLLDNLDNLNLGPSSLTLSRTVDENPVPEPPDTRPALKLSVTPKQRKVRSGRKTTVAVKVRNRGDAAASGVKVCLKSSGPLRVQGKRCRTFGKVMAGATQTRNFGLRAKKLKNRKFHTVKVGVQVRAANTAGSRTTVQVQVRR